MQKKKIATEINNVINGGFSIQTQGDSEFMKNENFLWDDLNNLKQELGNSIMDFCQQVNAIVQNPDVIKNLGEKKSHFEKLIQLFFNDVNEFSLKVRDIRVQHEDRTGRIDNLTDYNLYNRLAINYHSLYTELSALITPTLSDIMSTIAEVVPVQPSNTVEQQEQNHEQVSVETVTQG